MDRILEGRGVSVEEVTERLRRVALEEGLPFGKREMTYNSRPAQELGKWAETQGRGEVFHKAVFSAYFCEGINIALIPTLVTIATRVGLSGEAAEEVLRKGIFKDAVDLDWSRSREMDIVAAPTFMMNNQRLVGAQPYDALKRFLIANRVERRPPGHASERVDQCAGMPAQRCRPVMGMSADEVSRGDG